MAFGYRCCLRLCVCLSMCSCVRVWVYQSRACPLDNSPLVQARITKFRTKVQKTLVKVPIVFGDDGPWPSRSNLTWKSNFTSFWACPPHNSSAIQDRITKFGPKMHLSTVNIPFNFGLDWFWSSPSFSPEASFGLRVLSSPASVCLSMCPCVCVCVYQSLACPHDNSSAVHARITKFGWETQNTLVKMPIFLGGWSTLNYKVKFNLKVEFYLILSKPHDNFLLVKLESLNLDQKCILVWLRSLLFWRLIDLDLQCQI